MRRVEGKLNREVKCDARCMNAVGPSCECSCAGANHGGKRVSPCEPHTRPLGLRRPSPPAAGPPGSPPARSGLVRGSGGTSWGAPGGAGG